MYQNEYKKESNDDAHMAMMNCAHNFDLDSK